MAFKIEIANNALSVTETISGDIAVFQPNGYTWYEEDSLVGGFVKFYGTTDQNEKNTNKYEYNKVGNSFKGFPLAECVDSGDVVFTAETFRAFASLNLGKSSPATGATTLENRIIVNQTNVVDTLGTAIDSTKEYFIDGDVMPTGIEIEVPIGGMTIAGYGNDLSRLICTDDNCTLFKSPVGGSGSILQSGVSIEVSGLNSKVYELVSSNGFSVFAANNVAWQNCTSLGSLDNYFQGLETRTTRTGGQPQLELIGAWGRGYSIRTSTAFNLSAGTYSVYKAGLNFVMQSRFSSDVNLTLPTDASFFDFSDTSFPNSSTLDIRDVIVTRNGIITPNDPLLTPNISASNLSCSWKGNNGLPNTFVGAIATVTTEIQTGVTGGLPFILLGTFTNTDLQHFDSPSNGQLRHLGSNPREYTVNFDFVLDGGQNAEYKIELIKNDGATSIVYQQTRVVNNLQGGRDVAYFTGLANIILNKDEFVYWQVTNLTNNSNCTLELDSSWSVEER